MGGCARVYSTQTRLPSQMSSPLWLSRTGSAVEIHRQYYVEGPVCRTQGGRPFIVLRMTLKILLAPADSETIPSHTETTYH
jgi:hypothetical protein